MSNANPNSWRRLEILSGAIKTPPISQAARRKIGFLLGTIQKGALPSMPLSRPMPSIGPNVHELRISDQAGEWRVIYQIRPNVVYVADVFQKKTQATPKRIIDQCRKRFEQAE